MIRLIDEIEEFAIKNYDLGGVFSLSMMAKSTNVGNHGGMQEYFELPEKDKELKKILKDIRRYADDEKLEKIVDSTHTETRISAFDLGSIILMFEEKYYETIENGQIKSAQQKNMLYSCSKMWWYLHH